MSREEDDNVVSTILPPEWSVPEDDKDLDMEKFVSLLDDASKQ
jgi:hypothetical protein